MLHKLVQHQSVNIYSINISLFPFKYYLPVILTKCQLLHHLPFSNFGSCMWDLIVSTLDHCLSSYFPKDLFLDYFVITKPVIVPFGALKYSPYIYCCYFYIFWSFWTVGFTSFIWNCESFSQLGATCRRREGCCIFHYLSWTDSIKLSLLFSNIGCSTSKGSLFRMSHVMRKPVFAICKQQRHRSACASAISTFVVHCLDQLAKLV